MEKAREAMIKQVGKLLSCPHKRIFSGGPIIANKERKSISY